MTPNPESRRRLCELDRFSKSLRVSHQRSGGHYPVPVRLQNATIHAGSKSEIVGIDDQASHGASLAGKSGMTRPSSRAEFWQRVYESSAFVHKRFDRPFRAHVYLQLNSFRVDAPHLSRSSPARFGVEIGRASCRE